MRPVDGPTGPSRAPTADPAGTPGPGRLADRLQIDDLLVRYATAVDGRDWDLLDTVFTADARLDYRSAGGICGRYPEVRAWLAEVLAVFTWTQHLVVNRTVSFTGPDTATARSQFLNPNGATVDGTAPGVFLVGGAYRDRLVRTPAGWRIAERVEETRWWLNPIAGLPEEPWPVAED